MHFTNGAVYEGRFRNDAVDGQGTMKMSRALIIPFDEADEAAAASNAMTSSVGDEKAKEDSKTPPKKHDFMIPISFQSDMTHIHAKAGFTAVGH